MSCHFRINTCRKWHGSAEGLFEQTNHPEAF